MKLEYLEMINDLRAADCLVLREFLIKGLYSTAINQIEIDLQKLEDDKNTLQKLYELLQGEI